ncbi:hypothetical protein ACO0LD_16835 [Undibacterium sp. Ji83W]|uniref:hypothetical protein n=1 Tax=Undibacterium sp. Ji83W TaxID=3413043 RepID=UPI003BEF5A4C
MLKFFCSSLLVDINARQICISQQVAKFRRSPEFEVVPSFPLDIELDATDFGLQWQSVFTNYPDRKGLLEIVLDDVLVKFFVLAPPSHAQSLKDFHAAAQMRLETLFNVSSDDWLISADWQSNKPSLICAIPKTLLAKISGASKKSGQRILSLQPRFVWMWNQCKQRFLTDAWFVSVGEKAMTLGTFQEGSLRLVKTILLPEASDDVWLRTQLQREAMLHQLNPPTQLLLAGRIPTTWQYSLLRQTSQYQLAKKDLADSNTDANALLKSRVGAAS